jgi:hypothetical protein
VLAKNGVSRQLNVNKSHDIQFPLAVMPSEPMMIAGLSESLPLAKISMSTATAHGGSFCLFFVIFFHSTGILRWIGTKHEILVRKSRENLLERMFQLLSVL